MSKPAGKVYLVGAGPGDPGLLTVRGRELLERAEVVVYDNLVNEALLMFAPKAEHIFAGKRPDRHPLTQEDINRLLVDQARDHACVVRLKGGDPFLFGRGGEEALALAAAGVPFEIVPGVTAGVGAAAYAGIPLTHRGLSSSVTFITGHRKPEDEQTKPFDRLHLDGTLVFYMGVDTLAMNMQRLQELGRAPDTPAAVIEWGTYPKQRVVEGTIADIAERAREARIEAPSLVIVGAVAELRDTIAWFENRPLFGRRVAVTRTRRRAAEVVHLLHERGAAVFEFPTVEIDPAETQEPLTGLETYDWIVLTSVNGVDTLFERMAASGLDARDLHNARLCAISTKTAEALSARGLRVDLLPSKYETDTVVAELERVGGPVSGQRVLMPRADIGRSSLPQALREHGAIVDELQAYRTVIPRAADRLAEDLLQFSPDYIVFGSASAARNLHGILGEDRVKSLANRAVFAAIGPIAGKAAAEAGMQCAIVPSVHRIPDLVEAVAAYDAKIRYETARG